MEWNKSTDHRRMQYEKRMKKRMAGKPLPVRILMERTFNTSMMVLELIESVPFTQLTMEVYFFCKDVAFKEVVRLYDAQLELAGANPICIQSSSIL